MPGGVKVEVVDGHTEAGSQPVELDGLFTGDEVLQLIRSLNWALMMDSHEDKPPDHPQRLDFLAHRPFIKRMRDTFYQVIKEQYPELLKDLGPLV